ncbi:hypothetical protein [Fodinicola feengrottensis]|uniref:hypothetical protein n=1 Tax=Fodinicola feengrottensis TaxID=435914 RepID=UPI0024410BB4|nr:hypothetical protein [Fodinicola feengrottensis]
MLSPTRRTCIWVGVPKDSVQNRAAWQFYAGTSASAPTWSSDINARVPVLTDTSRRYSAMYTGTPPPGGYSVIGQGGVVYDKPLNRYIYTSWTEFTFEFYDSPTPYGPWQHFLTKDFGGYPWTTAKHGGYGVTIPSKFISADGTNMWLQSNVCPCASAGVTSVYNYSLRRMTVSPYAPTTPTNAPDDGRNLAQEPGTVPIEKSLHYGNVAYYNDGVLAQTDDDWNDENKSTSWWGYTWPRSYTVNKVAYTTGNMFSDGGWFGTAPTVQVRVNGVWTTVTGQQSTPAYPTNNTAGPNKTYVFSFDPTTADGVRIIGGAGGTRTFTSIAELQVYYGGAVTDPGFEKQPTSTVSAPWTVEGPDQHGIDRGGQQHSGTNNAWIRTSSKNWNAVTQVVPVKPNTSYRLTGWIRDTANVSAAAISAYGLARPPVSSPKNSLRQPALVRAADRPVHLRIQHDDDDLCRILVARRGFLDPGRRCGPHADIELVDGLIDQRDIGKLAVRLQRGLRRVDAGNPDRGHHRHRIPVDQRLDVRVFLHAAHVREEKGGFPVRQIRLLVDAPLAQHDRLVRVELLGPAVKSRPVRVITELAVHGGTESGGPPSAGSADDIRIFGDPVDHVIAWVEIVEPRLTAPRRSAQVVDHENRVLHAVGPQPQDHVPEHGGIVLGSESGTGGGFLTFSSGSW